MKLIVDNTYTTVEDIKSNETAIIPTIERLMTEKEPGYQFKKEFKNGKWDGNIRLFEKAYSRFPTGMLDEVLIELEDFEFELEDRRASWEPVVSSRIDLLDPEEDSGVITLRDYQQRVVEQALDQKRGIVNVATGGGKTEIASAIIKQLLPYLDENKRVLFVTHNLEIFNQSASRIETRLGINVGKIGGGKWNENLVNVVMVPTIQNYTEFPDLTDITYTGEMRGVKLILDMVGEENPESRDLMKMVRILDEVEETPEQIAVEILTGLIGTKGIKKEFQKMRKAFRKYQEKQIKKVLQKHHKTMNLLNSAVCIIGDEFHHTKSDTWYQTLLKSNNAHFRFGLTGTIDEEDPLAVLRMKGVTGAVIDEKISNEFLISNGYSAKPTIRMTKINRPIKEYKIYQKTYELGIVENHERNSIIAKQVAIKAKQDKGCLIIVNHIKHGENLYQLLEEEGVDVEFTNGQLKSEEREKHLSDMREGEIKVLIATSILDEGVDISGINCIWLAAGGKSFRQTLQRIGRGLRKKKDGSGLDVFDYVDFSCKTLLKHSQKRLGIYKAEGFEIVVTSDGN